MLRILLPAKRLILSASGHREHADRGTRKERFILAVVAAQKNESLEDFRAAVQAYRFREDHSDSDAITDPDSDIESAEDGQ